MATDKTKNKLIQVTSDYQKGVIDEIVNIAEVEGTTKAALLREGSKLVVKKYKSK